MTAADDGVSGVTFNRDGFKELLGLIESNQVSTLIVKDMSRLGRNYLEVSQPPDGYRYDTVDAKRWVVDLEAAEIVRHIYSLRLDGTRTNEIAEKLKREKILIPSLYAQQKGYKNPSKKTMRSEYLWDKSIVGKILTNRAYIGNVVNFRTYSRSYKLKKRLDRPVENWEVLENVHAPIIDRDIRESIQKSFGDTKYRKPKYIEKICLRVFSSVLIVVLISIISTRMIILITTTSPVVTREPTTVCAVRRTT